MLSYMNHTTPENKKKLLKIEPLSVPATSRHKHIGAYQNKVYNISMQRLLNFLPFF